MDGKSIDQYLLSFSKQRGVYYFALALAVLLGCYHAGSGIPVAYGLEKQNAFILLGQLTAWCQSPGLALIPFVPPLTAELCLQQIDDYYRESKLYFYGVIGSAAVVLLLPYFLMTLFLLRVENEVAFNLRSALYQQLMALQVREYEKPENELGGLASRFGNDTRDVCELLTTYRPTIIMNLTTIAGAIVICMGYDWRFGFLSLFFTPIIALSFYISMVFIGGYEDASLQGGNSADQVANELVTSIRTALLLNFQQRLLGKYRTAIHEPIGQIVAVGAKIGLFYGASHFILEAAVGLKLYLCAVMAAHLPDFSPISVVIFMVVSVYSGFTAGNNFYYIIHISSAGEAAKRLVGIIKAKTEREAQANRGGRAGMAIDTPKENIKGRVEFRNVSFKYKPEAEKWTIRNVSFVVEAGAKVGFVGMSGCGKSTLLNLLLRFYDFEGDILLDGVSVFDYDLKALRSYFAMLNQEPSLFTGTIASNVRYNTAIDDERLNEVCERACAYSQQQGGGGDTAGLISSFQQKVVGPKGSSISGGEKQRVACARALARDAAVFLMDEGTSALDRGTEMRVQAGIAQEFQGKTIINIAHRIETIAGSDRIFVFDDGELKEKGTYGELMKKRQYFYNLVEGIRFEA